MENPRKAAKCMDFLSTGEMMDFHRKGGEMGRESLSTGNPHTENRKCGEKGWGDPAKSYRETLRRGRPLRSPAHRTSCNPSVGADAPPLRTARYASVWAGVLDGPPHRTPCNLSLRSRCAHRLWQSASPVPSAPLPKGGSHGEAVTGGFYFAPQQGHRPLRNPIGKPSVGATLAVARCTRSTDCHNQ